ncbi:uncharacterized protein [Watersipora subatra]|uniref:uncharacterized protein n=1 Tax=Watersipora subatra TaxID=2589382 RepID=UPI00355B189F
MLTMIKSMKPVCLIGAVTVVITFVLFASFTFRTETDIHNKVISPERQLQSRKTVTAGYGSTLQKEQMYDEPSTQYAHLYSHSSCQQFHLMTMYFNMRRQKQYIKFSEKQLEERNRELLEVLQSNLNHPCVRKVHLFYINKEDLQTVMTANLTNSEKLHPVQQESLIRMADYLIYASKTLINKPAIALNGDIVLGEGLDLIDTRKMLEEKLVYSLTRYEGNLSCSVRRHMCINNYPGSHDTHIFVLKEALNESFIKEKLNYPINMNQAENGLIYTMRYLLGFNVTNPCKSVYTYHHHCSKVHGGRENTYTIYNLGWKGNQIHRGEAKPGNL